VTVPRQLGQLAITCDGDSRIIAVGRESNPRRIAPSEVFETVRFDAAGRYRPLSGARTLAGSWEVQVDSGHELERVIETIYPLALTHRRQLADGTLRIVPLEEVLARQSGRYEVSDQLSPAGRELAIETVCGQCVRQPVWHGATCGPEAIPCPEPCSILVSFCREAALWESEPPAPSPISPAIEFAAFDEPGNKLREHFLEARSKP